MVNSKEEAIGAEKISSLAKEKLTIPERARIVRFRSIQDSDLIVISKWAAVPETHKHLDFAPEVPTDWSDKVQVRNYLGQFESYYRNRDEDPKKITPLVGVNAVLDPVSVLTIRWRGDPYVPKDKRIAAIEASMTDPELRHRGLGKQTLSAALDIIFNKYAGYGKDETAREARLWVFTDMLAGDYTVAINLIRQFGFENLPGNWKEYAAKRNIENVGNRDAMWFKLTKEKWETIQQANPKLAEHAPIDLLNLRI